ncbi:hypothetical protein T02_6546 [Trichinella nativa]|uniref:Uncharacterized protein n=2 Tax=Trichinella TaxID=6333 RepID=A0A0V1KPU5_9BILA|nr:hypothetical protein T12_3313 [Trichinella patagoniensis]KRZ49467.1 hypothetical protein T02_6546 [Trichinella nativa]
MKLGGKPEVRQAVRCFCIPVAGKRACCKSAVKVVSKRKKKEKKLGMNARRRTMTSLQLCCGAAHFRR